MSESTMVKLGKQLANIFEKWMFSPSQTSEKLQAIYDALVQNNPLPSLNELFKQPDSINQDLNSFFEPYFICR